MHDVNFDILRLNLVYSVGQCLYGSLNICPDYQIQLLDNAVLHLFVIHFQT